jgi:hypothetical protein
MDDLNGLLEERGRFEKWIAQLTAKREQTPPHVYERVRADYVTRLETVMGQLRSHSDGLQASATSLEQRASTLATDEQQRRDARAEIELRAMVGEYSGERANMELAACDADIARLESERTAATTELVRLQEILALVRQPEARPAAPPPQPQAQPSRPLGASAPRTEADSAADELAFLNSVVERSEVAAAPSVPAPAAPPRAPAPTPALPPPRVVTGDIPLVTSLQTSDKPEPAAAQPTSTRQGTPAFLKGMPTEQVKSLKCQECGTMNYPTEWYCERCGGELATM